jgi:hypothetical protein
VERLGHLQAQGPTGYAFTFRDAYDPHGVPVRQQQGDECPTA